MGSGKSTVASIFRCLGIPVYDADSETKKLYNNDSKLKSTLINTFGDAIYPDGVFNAKALNDILVREPEKWNVVNQIVHPIVREHSMRWQQKQGAVYTIRESALLYEVGLEKEMNKVIVVTCPEPIRIQRVVERSHLDEMSIRSRMSKQQPEEMKTAQADYVIVNDGSRAILPQVLDIHRQLCSLFEKE